MDIIQAPTRLESPHLSFVHDAPVGMYFADVPMRVHVLCVGGIPQPEPLATSQQHIPACSTTAPELNQNLVQQLYIGNAGSNQIIFAVHQSTLPLCVPTEMTNQVLLGLPFSIKLTC
jgi:hypothetical protein